MLLFSPPCELIKLTHSFFSPPCERIKLMHSSFHHLVNLSNSCTLFSQPCELIKLMHSFFSPPWELISLMHSFSDCWHSDLYPTHARTLWFYETEWKVPGDIATTKTMWYRNLAWSTHLGKISNQINLHYSSYKYYHW